jgi:hypothetical protein
MPITPHVAAGVFLVVAAVSPASGAVLDVPVTPFIARLYEGEAPPPSEIESALRETQAIFADAGFALHWMRCRSKVPATDRCALPLAGAELAVRLVSAPQQSSSPRALPLGYSLVDGGTQGGALATIYVDRVRWLASASTADLATLLGRAIAHEIGHLLLGTTEHGGIGVMRAIWSRDSLRNSRPREWLFSRQEARQMRAAVAARAGE